MYVCIYKFVSMYIYINIYMFLNLAWVFLYKTSKQILLVLSRHKSRKLFSFITMADIDAIKLFGKW